MNDYPFILIQYDPLTWTPTAIFLNGQTDEITAKLQEIARERLTIKTTERPENAG